MREIWLVAVWVPVIAVGKVEIRSSPLQSPPVIDGVVDDAREWVGAATGEGLIDAQTDQPAPETMKFWVAYDEGFIYFAARAFSREPGTIRAEETRSDVSLQSNDAVTLSLDVTGTNTAFNSFAINPRGANSFTIVGGRAQKTEWKGEITTRGRITSEGFEVEARIPWAILRLPDPGPRTLRLNVSRYIQQYQRTFFWINTRGGRQDQAARWLDVEVPAQRKRPTLDLLPYSYLGTDDGKTIFNNGLDMRTELAPRIEATASLNPDFRNIENEILSLDFSYFERLAGESRPFFQEGASFFGTGYGARLFASQRVPSFDLGAKVFGQVDDRTQFGVMSLTTFREQQALVGAATYQPNQRENFDVAVTSLRSRDRENDAFFANYGRRFGDLFTYLNGMATFDQALGDGGRVETGFMWSRGSEYSYFNATFSEASLRPRLGFVSESNLKGFGGGYSSERIYSSGALLESEWGINASKYWRTDGANYRQGFSADLSWTFRNGLDVDLDFLKRRFEAHDDERYEVSAEYPRRDRYRRLEYNYTWGRLRSQRYQAHEISAQYRPVRNLQTSVSAEFVRHFRDDVLMIGAWNWDLTPTRSLSGRFVRSGSDWNAHLSFRQFGQRGNEYFLIFGDPNSRTFRPSLILKAVIPLSVGR